MTSASSFYPPRARWYSPFLHVAGRLCRRLALDHIQLPSGVSIGAAVAAVLFPGVGFYVCWPRVWGKAAIALSVVLLFIQIAWLGTQQATVAFGLLLSVHASGLALFCDRVLPAPTFRARLILAAALLAFVALCLYLPGRRLVQNHLFFPLRINERVIIVRREAPSIALHRGDMVAYSLEGFSEHALVVRAGFGLGPLLAMPGDQIRFTKTTFEVNGIAQPRLALMPEAGEWIVPQKHWFVWPTFGMFGHGHPADATLSETMLSLGTISERQFLGRPLRRWLWRPQL